MSLYEYIDWVPHFVNGKILVPVTRIKNDEYCEVCRRFVDEEHDKHFMISTYKKDGE